MKILLIILGALVVVVLVVVATGAALPKRHVVSRTALYRATPERLFALITGPQDWRPDLKSFERGHDAAGDWIRETNRSGENITYRVTLFEPPRRYAAWIADKNLPYGGSWTYEIQPQGAETALRITEDGEVYNPIFRFVSKFVIGHTRTIEQYLKAVAAQTGDNIQISD